MKVTNTERMNQLASSIDVAATVILRNLSDNPEILNKRVSLIKDATIEYMLNHIKDCCKLITDADPHYFADLDIGYTENNFPVKHY